MKKLAIVAIGGNSLIADSKHQTVGDQYSAICETSNHIADLIAEGYNVLVTHGNGPQVGFILRRSEIAAEVAHMHDVPLVSCDADTQGAIGYQIQQALDNEFKKRKLMDGGKLKSAVTVVTQVIVDKNDTAFKKPSKPIGGFVTEAQANELKAKNPDWSFVSDAGRGFRRVVASPKPIEIVELEAIKSLLGVGFCVIAVGGGGIPVFKNQDESLTGVDAVIDKDFATSLLAVNLKADVLIISTGVEKVYLNFGKPNQKALENITLSEAKQYMAEGHFAPGSMLPKIQAAVQYLENGGMKAIITSPEFLGKAIKGETGTHIVN
ncbi:MAG TPA: carbamate kinase [Lentisphaeria bacterium]|nr:MAG: carbamate kinase [Lentisphaerae bacterium GWF2_38_69]HBM17321.1 carbamate kinase [Lentisphaeria bacterium]